MFTLSCSFAGRQDLAVQRRRLRVAALELQHVGQGARRVACGRVGAPVHPAADRQHVPQQRHRPAEVSRVRQRLAQVGPRAKPVVIFQPALLQPPHELARQAQSHGARVALAARRARRPRLVPASRALVRRGAGLAGDVREPGVPSAGAPALHRQRYVPAVQADGAARRLLAHQLVAARLPVPLLARPAAVVDLLAPAAPVLGRRLARQLYAARSPGAGLRSGGGGGSVDGSVSVGVRVRRGCRGVRGCSAVPPPPPTVTACAGAPGIVLPPAVAVAAAAEHAAHLRSPAGFLSWLLVKGPLPLSLLQVAHRMVRRCQVVAQLARIGVRGTEKGAYSTRSTNSKNKIDPQCI